MKLLAFDIGATHTRFALAEDGVLGDVVRMDTDKSAVGFGKFLGALESVANGQVLGAVIGGIPGEIEGEEGVVIHAPNLPEWLGLPVLARLKALFDCRVEIVNDVMLCGLGEANNGAGITSGVMAYFTVSTGVNAVRIVDGEVDPSITRFEIGNELISERNGKIESLESLTGGAALQARLGISPSDVRDPLVWRVEASDLARGVYDTLLHWTPELVVFGGTMMRDIDLRLVRAELEKLPDGLSAMPTLKYSKLGDLAGLYGAVVWAESHPR